MPKCQNCGCNIIGPAYEHNGKKYCYACYETVQSKVLQLDQEKIKLFDYIKELFGIAELSTDVLHFIDRELKKGKTLQNIHDVIWYYYEVQGKDPIIENIIFVIQDHYEDTEKYLQKQKDIKKQNDEVNLNVPPVHVSIDPSKKPSRRTFKKITYNIEDL